MINRIMTALALTACSLAPSAQAHHSFAMFDMDQTVTVDATVKTFKWTMPHVWLYVLVPTENGTQEWGMEAHSPNIAARKGWSSRSVKAGDKIKVTMHPKKDGTATGSVIYITLPDGKVLWNAESETRT